MQNLPFKDDEIAQFKEQENLFSKFIAQGDFDKAAPIGINLDRLSTSLMKKAIERHEMQQKDYCDVS